MKISGIYSALTLPQRLRAMVSAFGRSDHEELDKLADSSRDGFRSQPKVKFHFLHLSHLAALHNSFLLEPCAIWLFSQTISPEEVRSFDPAEREALESCRIKAVEEAASVEAAFTAQVTAAGISASDWQSFRERLLDTGAKSLLRVFLGKVTGHELPHMVAQYRDAIEGYLFKEST